MKIKTRETRTQKFLRVTPRQLMVFIILLIIIGLVLFHKSIAYWMQNKFETTVLPWATQHGFVSTRYLPLGQSGPSTSTQFKQLLTQLWHAPTLWWQSSDSQLPYFALWLKESALQEIENQRLAAINSGVLTDRNKKAVNAELFINNNPPTTVNVRLKGLLPDHFATDKWSLSVKVKGKASVLGMRRFAIQSPITRDLIGPFLFGLTVQAIQPNIFLPRYELIHFSINDKNKGIMETEEGFEPEMMLQQQRIPGILLRFDDTYFMTSVANTGRVNPIYQTHYNNKLITYAVANETSERASEAQAAIGLLRGFFSHQLRVEQVFNVEQMAAFIASTDLWGAEHGLQWNNLRFYYNPITALIEPIPFDMELNTRFPPGFIVTNHVTNYFSQFYVDLMKDPNFYQQYRLKISQLQTLIDNGKLVNQLNEKQNDLMKILGGEFYLFERFNFDFMQQQMQCLVGNPSCQQIIIKDLLNDASLLQALRLAIHLKIINAYVVPADDGLQLELQNLLPTGVTIDSVTVQNKTTLQTLDIAIDIRLPLKLAPTPLPFAAKSVYIKLPNSFDAKLMTIKVNAHSDIPKEIAANIKHTPSYSLLAEPYVKPRTTALIPTASIAKQQLDNPFLKVDLDKKIIHIGSGKWTVKNNLIIPPTYQLQIDAGTTLLFSAGHTVIAYGDLQLLGLAQQPIVLDGVDTQGWNGIVVLNANKPSKLAYVSVKNTTGISHGDWKIPACIVFYASDVNISNSGFIHCQAANTLYFIHNHYLLDNGQFSGNDGRSVLSSFADGKVTHNK